jgi:hypothetical protein
MPPSRTLAAAVAAVAVSLKTEPSAAYPTPRSDAEATQPNILLFFPDEWRYDWGGLKNNPYYTADTLPLRTPHFDWVAGTGTRFTRAYVGAPVCAPSRACLASGRQYDQQGLPMYVAFGVDYYQQFALTFKCCCFAIFVNALDVGCPRLQTHSLQGAS